MKIRKRGVRLMMLTLFSVLIGNLSVQAQNYQATASNSTISVDGTSNIHDWDMKAEKFTAKANIVENADMPEIKALSLDLEAESLKSGKSGMDKNTYKALGTNKNKNIKFTYTKTNSLKKTAENTYSVVVQGMLEIAGVKKSTDLSFELVKKNGVYVLKGSKPINMPEYKVDPPTAMLGTIKTGEDVTINYNLNLQ